jgi:ribulose-phosphate 3-epimerase
LGRVMIYPSLLSADFSQLAKEIISVEKAGADGIHIDVMDGHFVPNITIGPVVVKSIRKVTKLPFWAHLMVEEPDKHIRAFQEVGVEGLFVHPETGQDMRYLSERIHKLGMQAGISINPETSVESIKGVLEYFEKIMVMIVHPGFGGQPFNVKMVPKITEIKRFISSWDHSPLIEVDGGINNQTAPSVVKAGADTLIAGSAIFCSRDPAGALKSIRRMVEAVH